MPIPRLRSLLVGLELIVVVLLVPAMTALADEATVHLVQDEDERYLPARLQDGTLTVLADIDSITAPALSPDGTTVAFAGAVGDESLGLYAIFTVGINGSGLTQRTSGSFGEFDPAWSPDGAYLVFSQNTSGSLSLTNCCRLARVHLSTGSVTALTPFNGAQRPEYSPDGTRIVYDNRNGVWTMPASGGAASLVSSNGFDPTFSPDGSSIAYVRSGSGFQIRRAVLGGSDTQLYATGRAVESPKWVGDQIRFIDHLQVGYDSRRSVRLVSMNENGTGASPDYQFPGVGVGLDIARDNDEIFFYRETGSFRYYNISPGADLIPISTGEGYSPNWDVITAVNLDGDADDELFFYRQTGSFRYYHVTPNANIVPIQTGSDYSTGWDVICAVDLDGDGQDEMFFYRRNGEYAYYPIDSDADLGSQIASGSGYSPNWDSITAVDLDGDGADEMFFYRESGSFRYYNLAPSGGLSPIRTGEDYSQNWDSITAIDLDGDGADEMFFYRESGSFRYYNLTTGADLIPIKTGEGYSQGWDSITAVDLD